MGRVTRQWCWMSWQICRAGGVGVKVVSSCGQGAAGEEDVENGPNCGGRNHGDVSV